MCLKGGSPTPGILRKSLGSGWRQRWLLGTLPADDDIDEGVGAGWPLEGPRCGKEGGIALNNNRGKGKGGGGERKGGFHI